MIARRLGLAFACLALAATSTTAKEPTRLRVLSYNIRHGEGMDHKLDLARIAGVIKSVDPHIVALQEVDKGCERSRKLDEPAELGKLTGMTPIFDRNIPFQGGEYGNAVLSKLPVAEWKNLRLPSHYAGEQRGCLVVEVTAPDAEKTPLRFLATHLDYRREDAERLDSVKMIAKAIEERPDVPAILAGDLNALPDSRTLAAFGETWTRTDSAPTLTFPADKPDRQIDYILVRPAGRWKVVELRVLDEPVASDHRPLFAVLELAD